MKKLLEDLYKIIIKETDLYKSLLNVLHEENQIILNSSVEKLHTNNKKKEVLILQIKLLDETCIRILEKIHHELPGQQVLPPSLKQIIESMKEPAASPMKTVYSKLLSIAQTVKEINTANDRLIKGSLRAIKSSISFLLSCASTGSPFYENNGQLKTDNFVKPVLKEEA